KAIVAGVVTLAREVAKTYETSDRKSETKIEANKKAANHRQVKGLKSKLSILQVSQHRRAEPNNFDETFRDSYFAAKVKKIPQMNCSVEIFELQDELGSMAASLPHVLLHKQQIFQYLMIFLSNEHYWSLVKHGVR
ncbi:hypothetical protein RFI_35706, partial [Reticulomyxa filosa]